jgi:O-antigen ligase
MWRGHPFSGVGAGQFTEHYYATAHNSYMLALAELGPIGLLLWTAAIYYAFKVTVRAQVDLAKRPDAAEARSWAMALLASLVGLVIPSIFLTLTYHPVLWIYLGLVGALYGAIRSHEPEFHVSFGWRDLGLVAMIDLALVVGTGIYTRMKGF